ncbi:MAG: DUF4240 domain-containing protein [Candidatus Thiodiazotropha sp.]
MMNEEKFWGIIGSSRVSEREPNEQLKESLKDLDEEDIKAFSEYFDKVYDELKAGPVGHALHYRLGGYSDDELRVYLHWIIGSGRGFYKKITENPKELVNISFPEEDFLWENYEGFGDISDLTDTDEKLDFYLK